MSLLRSWNIKTKKKDLKTVRDVSKSTNRRPALAYVTLPFAGL